MDRFRRARVSARPVAGLLLLCVLWSAGSLRADLVPNITPNVLPAMERQALAFALLAATAALLALRRRARWPRRSQAGAAVMVSLSLFVAPAGLLALSKEWVADLTRIAIFSLVPVFAVVLEPYIGLGMGRHTRGGLAAALVAVAGTLCVFPLDLPRSLQAGIAVCAVVLAAVCVAAANCWAVRVAMQMPGTSTAPMAAIAGATAAVGLATASLVVEPSLWRWDALAPELAWTGAIELPGLLLLFWLMRRMSAERMTTRFLLAPLMASLTGLALLRPGVDLRAGLGLLLLAAGSGWLLLAPEEAPEENSLTLNLHP